MPAHGADSADTTTLSDSCFTFLVSDPEELGRFMNFAGYTAQSLRASLGTDELARAMLDYFAANESALLAMCAASGLDAAEFMGVWQRLNRAM